MPLRRLRHCTRTSVVLAFLIPNASALAGPPQIYIDQCAACHGEDARGVKDQGASLVSSAFVKRATADDLKSFIMSGRQPDAPDSAMKLLMPAFDYLTDDEMNAVVAFVKAAH
jgi:alcohol dehydrogenase (quinone), cytochrome c subunit